MGLRDQVLFFVVGMGGDFMGSRDQGIRGDASDC